MSGEHRVELEGRNLREALDRACEALSVSLDQIEYELLESPDPAAGLARISAWAKNLSDLDIANKARQYVTQVCELMGLEVQLELEVSDGAIRILLLSEDAADLLEDNASGLEALQHLVNRAMYGHSHGKRISLDVENYREKKELSIKQVARMVCEKVMRENCVVTLKAMNAYDRRLVHVEVSQFPELASQSLGDGQMKRVQIFPASGRTPQA